jgi:hypothetical protein
LVKKLKAGDEKQMQKLISAQTGTAFLGQILRWKVKT